jgi:hypothetical protein
MFPNFIVIGGQKCGSTYIHDVLEEHPDIYLTPGETPYFQDPDYLETNIIDFEKLFDKAHNYRLIGIKRPDYLAKDECPARIKKHIPDAKLIVILRNPVSRAIAAYYHYIKGGFAPLRTFNEGMKEILNGNLKHEFPRTDEIVEYGFYFKHLQKYFAHFDKQQIHIILLDDLKKDNLNIISQLYDFLGIDSGFMPQKSLNKKPQKVIYSIDGLKLVSRDNQLNYSYSSDKMRLYPKDKTLIGKVRLKAMNGITNFLASHIYVNTKPQANQELKQKLYNIYEQDIVQLEQLIKRDLSIWKN